MDRDMKSLEALTDRKGARPSTFVMRRSHVRDACTSRTRHYYPRTLNLFYACFDPIFCFDPSQIKVPFSDCKVQNRTSFNPHPVNLLQLLTTIITFTLEHHL
ncbi:hypothetical protein L2E82_41566 [Cichorium intybus]|uniref:Uncharacterized protein n=1 Tax=Cichorium intybus TaxID=13427 RepID=A0ACB9ANN1_CICIN|nr:hypothetical protein L2E82_41566 [Cichorium intybus]